MILDGIAESTAASLHEQNDITRCGFSLYISSKDFSGSVIKCDFLGRREEPSAALKLCVCLLFALFIARTRQEMFDFRK